MPSTTSSRLRAKPIFLPPVRIRRIKKPFPLLRLPQELIAEIAWKLDTRSAQNLALTCRAVTGNATARLWRWLDLSVEHDRDDSPDLPETDRDAFRAEQARRLNEQRKAMKRRLEAVLAQGGDWWSKVEHFSAVLRAGSKAAIVDILSNAAPTIRAFKLCTSYDEDFPGRSSTSPFAEDGMLLRLESHISSAITLSFPHLTFIDLSESTLHTDTIILLCQLSQNLASLRVWVGEPYRPFSQIPYPAPRIPPLRRLKENTKLRQLCLEYSSSMGFPNPPSAIEALLNILAFSPGLDKLSLAMESAEPDLRVAERISALEHLKDFCWRESSDGGRRRRMTPRRAELLDSAPALRRWIVGYGSQKWQFPTVKADADVSLPMLEVAVVFCDSWGPSSSHRTALPPPAPILPLKPDFARWLEARPCLHTMYFQPTIRYDDTLEIFREVDALEATGKPNGRIQSLRHGQEELIIVRLLLHDITVAKRREGRKVDVKRRVLYVPDRWQWFRAKTRAERAWQVFSSYKGVMVPLEVIKRVKEVEGPGKAWNARGVEVGEAAWAVLRSWRAGVPDSEIQEEEDIAPSEDDWTSGDELDLIRFGVRGEGGEISTGRVRLR